jgi:hypothetical protein
MGRMAKHAWRDAPTAAHRWHPRSAAFFHYTNQRLLASDVAVLAISFTADIPSKVSMRVAT